MIPANIKNPVIAEISLHREFADEHIWKKVRPVFFHGVSEIIRPLKVAVAMKARSSVLPSQIKL